MHGEAGLEAEVAAREGEPRLDAGSLERLVPDELRPDDVTGAEALRISLERYEFAARHACAGRLLDIACGVGYGTRLLADRASQVSSALGVDIAPAAVEYATRRYGGERVSFRCGDGARFDDPLGFDTIVSIETIEHLAHPRAFVDRIASLLRPDGVLVASVPVTPSVDANPHHLQDFDERSFRRLFEGRGLVELASFEQDQRYSLLSTLTRSELRLQEVRPNLPLYYLRHPRSLLRRLGATLRHGFKNRYLTVAWRREG